MIRYISEEKMKKFISFYGRFALTLQKKTKTT